MKHEIKRFKGSRVPQFYAFRISLSWLTSRHPFWIVALREADHSLLDILEGFLKELKDDKIILCGPPSGTESAKVKQGVQVMFCIRDNSQTT